MRIAAITITAQRASGPWIYLSYYTAGLGVAQRPANRAAPLFSGLSAGGSDPARPRNERRLGFLIWLLERRKTEHFSGGARGLGPASGGQCAMDEGRRGPTGAGDAAGRLVAIGWIFGDGSGGVHGRCDLDQREMQGIVHDTNDLRHVRVGAVANSPTVTYLDRERIAHQTSPRSTA